MLIEFSDQGWEDYLFRQAQDRSVLKRINTVICDIQRSPFDGIGKPEPLKHNLSGFWSRRPGDEHRLVYAINGGRLLIAQCRYHY
jgi:toxin YoeB